MLHFLNKFVMPLEIVLLFVYRHIDPNLSGTHNNQNDYRADGNNCLTPQNHRTANLFNLFVFIGDT